MEIMQGHIFGSIVGWRWDQTEDWVKKVIRLLYAAPDLRRRRWNPTLQSRSGDIVLSWATPYLSPTKLSHHLQNVVRKVAHRSRRNVPYSHSASFQFSNMRLSDQSLRPSPPFVPFWHESMGRNHGTVSPGCTSNSYSSDELFGRRFIRQINVHMLARNCSTFSMKGNVASNLPSFPNRKNGVALRKVGMTTSFFFRMFIFTTMDHDCEVLDRILKARFVLLAVRGPIKWPSGDTPNAYFTYPAFTSFQAPKFSLGWLPHKACNPRRALPLCEQESAVPFMHVSVPKVRCKQCHNLSWKRAAMNISFISQFLLPRIKSDHRWHHRLENVHPGIEGNIFVAEKPSVRVEGIGSIMQTEILLRVFDVESKQSSHLCPEAASKTCPDLFGFWFLPFFWLRLRRHSFLKRSSI